MANLREVLTALSRAPGINTAVVASRDGFVIDGASRKGAIDADAVGAVISTGIGSSEVMGREMGVGRMAQTMVEYEDGIIMISFVGEDAMLAVVANLDAPLGGIRFQVKKFMPFIVEAL